MFIDVYDSFDSLSFSFGSILLSRPQGAGVTLRSSMLPFAGSGKAKVLGGKKDTDVKRENKSIVYDEDASDAQVPTDGADSPEDVKGSFLLDGVIMEEKPASMMEHVEIAGEAVHKTEG